MKRLFIVTVTLLSMLAGCDQIEFTPAVQNGNPTPKDFLDNEDADIFVLDGMVYSNAEDVDWVLETEYVMGEEIGEIKKQATSSFGFNDSTSNILPVGTKIYNTNSPLYIAIVEGKEIPYLKMVEG
ncbi:hypothetical protein [Paenisporosarcina cavernae]|uniref:Lipoprotein n=1 Tax=Paenisporosarcina cavernae TaxID=2320858 RepID=A0A385YX10_9BACL|nr:hypothetical protein [Paenisporosarcina cavernae]AYC30083.1 hypothetical protein D3873_09435 [Paenisporosarcina cavernae]